MIKNFALIEHVSNPNREAVANTARRILEELGCQVASLHEPNFADSEIIIAVGGDGTLLRAAEKGRSLKVPVIGFNAGHMGFLTEGDYRDLALALDRLANGEFTLEERVTIDVSIEHTNGQHDSNWALNEAAIGRTGLAHPANFAVGVDGRALSAYAADGIIIATPTGSTAYSFSAGGPIIWPDVEAMLFAPLAAHGLFTTPLVLGPNSQIQVQIDDNQRSQLQVWFDGLRMCNVRAGDSLTAQISPNPVVLARLSDSPFSERLVKKFHLPVASWKSGGSEC
ncbi:NAD(+)/NADH kinase [Actinomycetaceae bacterium TAE3-ERU4]|nr:NAD(+)/NADH kinase [Actinomycetaceae bacterium TAE3-ERU4]